MNRCQKVLNDTGVYIFLRIIIGFGLLSAIASTECLVSTHGCIDGYFFRTFFRLNIPEPARVSEDQGHEREVPV